MPRYLPNMVIAPRSSMIASTDRRTKDEHRDKLARDLERFLARGGAIEQLPGPTDPGPMAHHEEGWDDVDSD